MKFPRLITLILFLLLIPLLPGGVSEVVEVDADLPGVALFLDGTYVGDAPRTLTNLTPGYIMLAATRTGHPPQEKKIRLEKGGEEFVFFAFGKEREEHATGMIRISDCIGTPEQTGLRGTSVTVATLPDGTLMAYYTGFGQGVQCAGSHDGSRWYEYPDGCLAVSAPEGKTIFQSSRPWVFEIPESGFRMIYLAHEGEKLSLFSAFSIDGFRFTPEGKVTINHDSDTGTRSPEQYSIPTGLRLSDGRLRIYYSAQGSVIKSAVSEDNGVTWYDEDGYRVRNATDPTVHLLPGGQYSLMYVDLSAGYKGQRIMAGISSDGLLFNKSDEIMILGTEENGVWILDPEIYVSPEGKWTLYYSVMGIPGETGIDLPSIMKSVIDPNCLQARFSSRKGTTF